MQSLRQVLPFLERQSVEQDEADRSKREAIRGLFEELSSMSSKIVALSVSLLLEGDTLDGLDVATEAAAEAAIDGPSSSNRTLPPVTRNAVADSRVTSHHRSGVVVDEAFAEPGSVNTASTAPPWTSSARR